MKGFDEDPTAERNRWIYTKQLSTTLTSPASKVQVARQ